jgi:[ribosomal protein S5]-alanine N-acetyltransferase
MPRPIIVTSRLRLRPPELADAEAIFHGYGQDPEVARYVIWRPHGSVADAEAFLRDCIAAWSGSTRFPWVITRESDDTAIGMIDARLDAPHRVTVGYVLARPDWGKGYVTEALAAVIEAFWVSRPEIYRIWAVCDVDNPASARVMEKAGMLYEGRLARYLVHPNISDEPRDAYIYAITR